MNAPVAQSGRIGPNAITRLAEALRADLGERRAACVFGAAGLGAYLVHPPDHMVDEAEVGRLHWALREVLPVAQAERLSRIAGDRTADYLLAHRIPKPVQRLLRLLPAPFASYMLLRAIRGHAWTFAGSGRFSAIADNPSRLVIADNPMCRGVRRRAPQCHYYAATFERLFRALVHERARVVETACEACGAEACVFEVAW